MSLFEIDEALDLSIESATEHAAEGEISDELRAALSEHVDGFGDKVDRVAKLHQGSGRLVDAAQKETWRLENRRKAAENLKIRHNTCLWCPNKAISLSLSAADQSLDRAAPGAPDTVC